MFNGRPLFIAKRGKMGTINSVCRNFDYNETANGVMELIRLHCDQCEHNDCCDIKTAYQNAKDYAASMEFVVNTAESEE